MRSQLSAPVSLIVMIVGALLIYYVLHSNGWSWSSDLVGVYKHLSPLSRSLVIAGLIANAWGLGGFINALVGRKQAGPLS